MAVLRRMEDVAPLLRLVPCGPPGPALPALVLAAALAACATPPSPLETAARAPVPPVAEAFGPAAPVVLPEPGARELEAIVAAARRRGGLTLEDCVRASLASREDLASAAEDRLQALLRRDVALAGLLPQARMLLRHDRQDPTTFAGGGGGTGGSEPARTQWSLNVIQPLFRGLREFHTMRSEEASAAAYGEDLRELRRSLATSVARAFILAVESEAEIRALEEALLLDGERVKEVTARAEQGLARRTEVLLQESRRETTRASVLQARERRDASRTLLELLSGVPGDIPLDPGTAPPGSGPVPSREEALAEAVRRRPDLGAAERRAEAARFDRKVASGARWPAVAATANWYLDRWNYPGSSSDVRWDLGLVAEVPLFLGGEIDAAERTADSRVRQADLDRSSALRNIAQDVDAALLRLKAGLERLESLKANERFARENLSLLQEEYRQGLATNLEVFTAQILLQDAAVGLERQDYQSRLDRIEVFLAMGRDDVVGVPVPSPAPPPAHGLAPSAPEKP